MKDLVALALTLTIVVSSFSQSPYFNRKFGDVTVNDFAPSAADSTYAVVLFDVAKNEVDVTSGTYYKRHIRYKLLKNGVQGKFTGDFVLTLKKGTLRKPHGATYTLSDGKIIVSLLSEGGILRGKHDKDREKIVVTFPNVTEGSIVEFEYVIEDINYYLPSWNFQEDVPVLLSEYTIYSPIKHYQTNFVGELKATQYESKYEGKFQRWLLTNIPAFKKEEFMPDENAYISSVEFSAGYKSWEDVFVSYRKSKAFWGRFEYNNFLNDDVRELTAGITDSLQMLRTISSYVKENYKFNGVFDLLADDLHEIIDRKSGSVGDLNILLAAMARKAGFNVDLIMLSTRGNGFIIESFPTDEQFNYVIGHVVVNKKQVYLDATEKFLPFDMLPGRCLNHRGFLIAEKHYGWKNIESTYRDKINVEANLLVAPDGNVSGDMRVVRGGYSAYDARLWMKEVSQEKFIAHVSTEASVTIAESKIENPDSRDETFNEFYQISDADASVVAGDFIYLDPHFVLRGDKNPFTSGQRKYPVDFSTMIDHQVITHFSWPEGYELQAVPENKVFALPGGAGRFSFNFAVSGNKITIATRQLINQTFFYPEEYYSLREFYTRAISKKEEQIVLKKK
jgi:hypothetical protein